MLPMYTLALVQMVFLMGLNVGPVILIKPHRNSLDLLNVYGCLKLLNFTNFRK